MFHRINHVNQNGEITGGWLIPGEIPIEYVKKLVTLELKRRPLEHKVLLVEEYEREVGE